jgi:hypothetical protein
VIRLRGSYRAVLSLTKNSILMPKDIRLIFSFSAATRQSISFVLRSKKCFLERPIVLDREALKREEFKLTQSEGKDRYL